jgi:Ca2+ transporting ATPase
LKTCQPNIAHVIRHDVVPEIDAVELMCSDVIEVGKGQQVPADCRIIKIKSTHLSADELVLTDEL